jgi:protein AroM
MTTRVGMITIGQSPRKDVVPEIKEILGKKIEVTECGALDGLSRDEVRRLAPTADDDVLVTRLQSGEEVIVGESRILVELQNCVDRLADECDLLALLCTGKFPLIRSKRIILMPEALLDGIVNGILGNITLGVLIPSERQRDQISKRWRRPDRKVVVESASPYSSQDEVTPSAQKLASSAPDFIVLDCMGFTSKTRETVRRITARPVILPRSVLAHSILELIG